MSKKAAKQKDNHTERGYLGVIGGSGLYSLEAFKLEEEIIVSTPFGEPSAKFRKGTLNNVPVIFLARHGDGHVLTPTEVNYRANIWAMKHLGVRAIFSVSAVGSLREKIKPGHMVVIDQFIDRTKARPSTFFEKGIVAHLSFAHPVSNGLRKILIKAAKKAGATVHKKGTYVCMEGPLFSTVAESQMYRKLSGDVIGMTNLQEAKLAREAEIDYATLALATDYDCWHPRHDSVTIEQILSVMKNNIEMAQKILTIAVKQYDFSEPVECANKIPFGILTDRQKIPAETFKKLEPLLRPHFPEKY